MPCTVGESTSLSCCHLQHNNIHMKNIEDLKNCLIKQADTVSFNEIIGSKRMLAFKLWNNFDK